MKKATVLLAALGLLFVASPSAAADSDGDGVADGVDNCLNDPNPAQVDSNFDGFGNACDPDLWNDELVEEVDWEIFLKAWGTTTGDPDFNPDADFDGDGGIGGTDYLVISRFWDSPPGPSGLACAGTIPCAAGAPDTDSDGVGDLVDNCVNAVNATQDDSNLDGIGTACDPDYNDDGSVDQVDWEVLVNAWGSTTGDPNFNPDCDHNGDGGIGGADYLMVVGLWTDPPGPPGPSGAGASFVRATASSTRCDSVGCP